MASDGRLKGKVAVVTGGASGIGLAIVERFHGEGASVVIADISGAENEVAARLNGRALALHADVTSSAELRAMLNAACEHFGGIDILCNNAGIDGDIGLTADCSEDNFERVMAINARGAFLGMKHAIPLLQQRGGGSIVNISSVAALIGRTMLGVYGASKGAINQLTRAAAVEYARDNIRINAICPGGTETPLVKHLIATQPEWVAGAFAEIPMGRFAQPSEIADAALFLASDESSFITGVTLAVDGGCSVP